MRIAVIGVSHWHVPMYLEYLAELEDVQVTAVSDPNPDAIARARQLFPDARAYADYRRLLDREDADLIMAHAPHDQMTQLASDLVDKGIPFHMEKPMGLDADALAAVAERAASRGLFVSVPLVTRMFGVAGKLLEMAQTGELGPVCYYYFRLFAPGPHRYPDMGVAWMLDPARAGEGPLFNFGPHAIDLFIAYSGALPDRVFCTATYAVHRLRIPDAVTLIMTSSLPAEPGQEPATGYGVAEVSYTSPEGYDRHLIVRTPRVAYSGLPDAGEIWVQGQPVAERIAGPTFDEAYRLYTHDLIARLRDGRPPLADIQQMVSILRVLNAAQRSLKTGQVAEVS